MKWLDKKISQSSIRLQLILTVVTGVVVLLVSLIVASTWVTSQQLRQVLINQGLQTTANLAESSVLALLYRSPENANAAVNAALSLQGVAAVAIYTADGELLVHAGNPPGPEKLSVASPAVNDGPRIYNEDREFWYYLAPVVISNSSEDMDSILFKSQGQNDEKHLGYVYVIGSKTSLDRTETGILLSNLTITLVIGLMLLFAIQLSIRRLIQPLDRITEVMKKAEQGDYVPEANMQGPPEIHHIAGAYNRMIKALTERDRELRKQNVQLEKQAIHDYLTGLVNRIGFEKALEVAVDECRTQGSQDALCYMDLDKFKIVNDSCGHNAGDILLQNVSSIFKRHIRKDTDVLARVGGDEFTILLKNCPIEKARSIGEDICKDINHYRFRWADQLFSIGVSIGIVPVDEYVMDYQDVLKTADSACYLAKEGGRGRVYVVQADEENLKKLNDSAYIAKRIGECLDNDLFELFYQPAISLAEEGAAGERVCEMLLRIPAMGEGEYLLPGSFISVAERYNMMKNIDRWVVSQTLEYLTRTPALIELYDVFSINITLSSMLDKEFVGFLEAELAKFSWQPDSICFEIIETDFINNLDGIRWFVSQAKRLGCRVAIDDFTGSAATTGNLQSLAIDYLKIDTKIML